MRKNLPWILVFILSAISGLFFFGVLIPDYPYSRRLTLDQAKTLYEEYKKLVLKLAQQKISNAPISQEDSNRLFYLQTTLTKAGFTFCAVPYPPESPDKVSGYLESPLYIKEL